MIDFFKATASNEKEAKKVLEEVNSYSEGFLFKADVSNLNEVNDMYEKIKKKYNRLDVLVNNAGAIIRPGGWKEISEEDWQRTIDINLKGVFNCIKVFADLLKESKSGRIINFTSTVGISAVAPVIAYGAAKAGVINLTNAFAKVLAPTITVNAIAPGVFWTPLQPNCWVADKIPTLGANAAVGHGAMPYQLAPTYVFLASDDSSYMTGQIIHVNGGEIMG